MIIFSPGPANISERVRRALCLPDICHRGSEFSELLREIRSLVLKVLDLGDKYESVILGGSGTLAIESIIASLRGYDKKVLIISNGIYGERAADIAKLNDVKIKEIRLLWGDAPDLSVIKEALKDKDIGAVYIVHHETTTGLLNPLKELSLLAKDNGNMMLVDGVSSIGGESLDMRGWGIDAIAGSANKCIRGVPGVALVAASARFLKTIEKCKSRAYYSSLSNHLKMEKKDESLFTPPVHAMYAFREALRELLDVGVGSRIDEYRMTAKILRKGLKDLGFRFYIPEYLMSNTMTVVYTPEGYDYDTLSKLCKKEGYVIYASQGMLSKETFRIGTVGLISNEDITGFLGTLKNILKVRAKV